MMPLGYHIGDLWGKQEERRPGDTEKQWAFQYVVAMETGNAQYWFSMEEVNGLEIN